MKIRGSKFLMILAVIIIFFCSKAYANAEAFSDVAQDHWAYEYVTQLRSLGITDGIGNNMFGVGADVKRAEFIKFLVSLMEWELVSSNESKFKDNSDSTAWYYSYIETALANSVIDSTEFFYPTEPITREDMAVMIVRALGYDELSKKLTLNNVFDDVTTNSNYIAMAKDFGIITGITNELFAPKQFAKKEQAAAMMMRMHNKLASGTKHINGFYAIKSYDQIHLIDGFDSVGFGWCRLEYSDDGVFINTTKSNNNEYNTPSGYAEPLNTAKSTGASALLMVAADYLTKVQTENGEMSVVNYAISTAQNREAIADNICVAATEFDGVVIDFEALRGEQSKANFNDFLTVLRGKTDKLIYVAVQPVRANGQAYYDGYDYGYISEVADKLIIMAHDYEAKRFSAAEMESNFTTTPLAPLNEIYYALKAADKVNDKSKILLQISFSTAQINSKDSKIINEYPERPPYSTINNLLAQSQAQASYYLDSPYLRFENDGIQSIIWYEDANSVSSKIELAKMFGITGVSYWRLGIIPAFEQTEALNIAVMIKD